MTGAVDRSASASPAASSAADEWSALVAAALVGSDRHPPPPASAGWDIWGAGADAAVALLDRALALVAARRAGAQPESAVPGLAPAPPDPRPPCPHACTRRLQRIVAGEQEVLLAEWLHRCDALGMRPPPILLPPLLLRARRHPDLDALVRQVYGARAGWLAEQVPELGVRAVPAGPAVPARRPPPGPVDSAAAVTALVGTFVERHATWAAAPQLRLLVASLDPEWLPEAVRALSHLPFDPVVERTRADVLALAEFRQAMLHELEAGSRGGAGERLYGGAP